MNERDLRLSIARLPLSTAQGVWYRHSGGHIARDRLLAGSPDGGGRWAANDRPILYLGRPNDSIVVEAYRHLVDTSEGIQAAMVHPRQWVTVQLRVHDVLDLTDREHLAAAGLATEHLRSPVGDYGPCQRVARAAAALGGIRAIKAPAATGIGITLAIIVAQLQADDELVLQAVKTRRLPDDPRVAIPHERQPARDQSGDG